MRLSLLDQVPHYAPQTSHQAFQDLLQLVQAAEKMGYHRFWVAEHHNTEAMLSSAPDILAAYLLSGTQKIRIGSGGVMAMHYGSLQMAERFSLLAALFPDRVDMGIGRAPGSDIVAARALNQDVLLSTRRIDELVAETVGFIRGNLPATNPYVDIKVTPKPDILPQIWLLGSSGNSAAWAGQHELNYAYAQFFTGHQDPEILDYYRHFVPEDSAYPHQTLSALSVCAADSFEEAEYKALPVYAFRYQMAHRQPTQFQSPEQMSAAYIEQLKAFNHSEGSTIVGTYDQVADHIRSFQTQFKADEIMLITYQAQVEDKIKIYQELANRLI